MNPTDIAQVLGEIRALQLQAAVLQAQMNLITSWLGALTGVLVLIGVAAVSTALFRRQNGRNRE